MSTMVRRSDEKRGMSEKAALVTGASSGIGYAITEMLAREGYGVTMIARRKEKLEHAARQLQQAQLDVSPVTANVRNEEEIKAAVQAHRDRYGRLDVLVNNAGLGIGSMIEEHETKHIDLQLDVNLRAVILFYRECVPLLRQAGSEHRNAMVFNTASIAGKRGQAWLSVYSATKHGIVGFTQAMHKELSEAGIKSCAICPGLVDTPMTEAAKDRIKSEDMIAPQDIAKVVQALLGLSPACIVPEVMFIRPGM
jgi:NAD(P)-dependent dehydrogenase (short-subunit alcohol dehydrogenase family)